MTRTRTALGLGLAAGLALSTALAGPASAGKIKDPLGTNDCYDVVGGSAGYTASTGEVLLLADLAQPSCRKGSYTLRVYDETGTLGSQTLSGDGKSARVSFRVLTAPKAPDSLVAVEVTTSLAGNVIDIAPDPVAPDQFNDQNGNGILDIAEVLDGSSPVLQNFK